MKVKVINKNINQQFDCEEVEIDGYKYYIDYFQPIEVGKWYISNQSPRLCVKIKEGKYPYIHLNNKGEEIADFYRWKGVIICSNNPNIDIPKVVDEVEKFIKKTFYKEDGINFKRSTIGADDLINGFKIGYNKSQETYSFSEEDMIEFAEFVAKYSDKNKNYKGEMLYAQSKYDGAERTIDLLQLWKEQQPKIIYYNE